MLRKKLLVLIIMVLAVTVVFAIMPAMSAGASQKTCNFGLAWLRIAHASPDAPAVDVYLDGWWPVARNLKFTGVTNYKPIFAGTHNIQVVPAGAKQPVVISANVALEAGKYYTVAATNVLASIAPAVYVDNNCRPAKGNAKVRFIHLSPNAPAVDIGVAGGGPVLFADVSFTEASDYIEVPAGTYDLDVRLAGTNTVVLQIPGVALKAGKVYTAFAEGIAFGEPPLQAVLVSFQPNCFSCR